MNKQEIIIKLKEFGLDDIEVGIYLNLLESEAKSPLEISRETNINRSRVYRYIEKLKNKKMVEQITVERGIKLKAADPDTLSIFLVEKERELEAQKELLPNLVENLKLISTSHQNPFEVKHYHGLDGMKQMLWNQLKAKRELLVFSFQTRNDIVGKKFAEEVREEQVRRKITLYEIENYIDPPGYLWTKVSNWAKFYSHRYVSPKVVTIEQNTAIFNDTVAVMNWTDKQKVGFELVNPAYALMQKQLFWYFWNKVAVFKESPSPVKDKSGYLTYDLGGGQ